MTRAAKDAPPAICRWGVVGCLGVAAADGEPRPRLRLRADRPDLGAAAGEGEMTVSLRACGHTGRPCRCAHLRRAARVDMEERAETLAAALAAATERTDTILRRVWDAVGNSALESLEVWDAVAAVREAVATAEERADRYRVALEEIAVWSQRLQDDIKTHGDGIAMWRGCVATAAKALEGTSG